MSNGFENDTSANSDDRPTPAITQTGEFLPDGSGSVSATRIRSLTRSNKRSEFLTTEQADAFVHGDVRSRREREGVFV